MLLSHALERCLPHLLRLFNLPVDLFIFPKPTLLPSFQCSPRIIPPIFISVQPIRPRNNHIQPSGKSVPRHRDLSFDQRHRTGSILPAQLLPFNLIFKHVLAHQFIRIISPFERTTLRITDIQTGAPFLFKTGVYTGLEAFFQLVRESYDTGFGGPASGCFDDFRVPDLVQVYVVAAEEHVDGVAAAEFMFRVERLVDVADEVEDEAEGLGALGPGEGFVLDPGGL